MQGFEFESALHPGLGTPLQVANWRDCIELALQQKKALSLNSKPSIYTIL
jgi:hypothetical protein